MSMKFKNKTVGLYKVRTGMPLIYDGFQEDRKDRFCHIVKFSKNRQDELILMVVLDDGDVIEMHPSNLIWLEV